MVNPATFLVALTPKGLGQDPYLVSVESPACVHTERTVVTRQSSQK